MMPLLLILAELMVIAKPGRTKSTRAGSAKKALSCLEY